MNMTGFIEIYSIAYHCQISLCHRGSFIKHIASPAVWLHQFFSQVFSKITSRICQIHHDTPIWPWFSPGFRPMLFPSPSTSDLEHPGTQAPTDTNWTWSAGPCSSHTSPASRPSTASVICSRRWRSGEVDGRMSSPKYLRGVHGYFTHRGKNMLFVFSDRFSWWVVTWPKFSCASKRIQQRVDFSPTTAVSICGWFSAGWGNSSAKMVL